MSEHRTCLHVDQNAFFASVTEADIVVLASPVYYAEVSAQLKGFIDRTFSYLKPDYTSNPVPSRLSSKKLVFILTQGHPDEAQFNDIFPRYSTFLKWLGFSETHLLRACGIGPFTVDAVPEQTLVQADELARQLIKSGNQIMSF